MNLTTRRKLKLHIGIPAAITSKDSLLDQIIEGASAYIETYTNRKFGVEEYTEVLDGTPEDEIFLKQYPVVDILSLTISGNEVDLDAEEESDQIILDKETGSVYRENGFGSGRKAVRITYTAGYNLPEASDESGPEEYESGGDENLPAAIEAAAIRLSARVYERRTAEGVSSVSPGSMSVQYKDAVDSDIVNILDAHKKRRV
jgi:hypothetical protein